MESGDAKTAVVLVYLKQQLSSPLFVGSESCSGSGQVTGRHTVGNDQRRRSSYYLCEKR